MKKKFGSIWRVMVALMLVASLAVVFSPGQAVLANGPYLTVNVNTYLKDTATGEFTPASAFEPCQDFYVNATVINTGDSDATDVQAKINFGSNVAFADGETLYTKSVAATIEPGNLADVWWKLHCETYSCDTINVGATCNENANAVGSTDIIQTPPPVLDVDIIEAPCGVATTDTFAIKATVTNVSGTITAPNVVATISGYESGASLAGSPVSFSLGDMPPGDSHEVGWTLHCDKTVDTVITVDADFEYEECHQVSPDKVTVHQKLLGITDVVYPEKVCTEACDTWNQFQVTANINNWSSVALDSVTATLKIDASSTGTATIASTNPVSLGTVADCSSVPVSWTVECTAVGDVVFYITASGVDSETGVKVTDTSANFTVSQQDFLVNITSVEAIDPDGGFAVSTEQNFRVTATLRNCSGTGVSIPFVDAILTVEDGDATIVSPGATQRKNNFCDCCEFDFTWTLLCTGPDDAEIIVDAFDSTGAPLDSDTVTVEQQEKAHLIGGASAYLQDVNGLMTPWTAFTPCQYFHVVIPVANTGEAAAEDVTISYNMTGPATVVSVSGDQFPATIPGGETRKMILLLHCDGEGEVTFTNFDLSGIDHNTQKAIPGPNLSVPCDFTLKQVPLTVEIIQPETCNDFAEGDFFTVKALIVNGDDTHTINGVSADLIWTGKATPVEGETDPKDLGDLEPGERNEVTWEMQCTGPGDVNIWVNVTGTITQGEPAVTFSLSATTDDDPQEMWFQPVTIHQTEAPQISIYFLSPDWFNCWVGTGQEFAVTAVVLNESETTTAENVYAYLRHAEQHPGDGASVTFYLNNMCVTPGTETILVNGVAQVRDVDYTINYELGLVTFTVPPPTGAKIEVFYLWDVSLVEGEQKQFLGDIEPLTHKIVSWTLRLDTTCEDSCGTRQLQLFVEALSDNAPLTMVPMIPITVYPAAKLVVDSLEVSPSTTITVCDEFTVTAVITNTGQADAWEASATLSVYPEGTARLAEGEAGYTKYIGTLTGWGTGDSAELTWNLHCKEACETTITVTPAGYSECGYYVSTEYGYGDWYHVPGLPLDDRFIKPASITVKQVADADLAVEKVADDDTFTVGEEVTFTITVTNPDGPADASGVKVTDLLPSGVNYTGSAPSQGWYDVTSGIWHVGDLAVDGSATLAITATVNTVGDINNIASITAADQADPTTSNNSAMATITGQAADLRTVSLVQGWNLMSLPLIPEETDIEDLLNGLNVDSVYAYSPGQDWKFYVPSGPGDLTEMNDGWGYWMKMNAAGTLIFDGWELVAETDPPSVPPSYPVVEGWNLIGFKSTTPKLASEYLAAIEGQYTILYGYANGSFFIVGTAGHEYLEPGLGYWLAIKIGESGTIFP